ncbi:MAG: peptidase S10 [Verrucomicrobiae bacterium]|nr:peptidase S10 [Verrucomicrobiae bacterium]NNJ42303.1 peptidase S10 [Akkermansiaceae bacterium]
MLYLQRLRKGAACLTAALMCGQLTAAPAQETNKEKKPPKGDIREKPTKMVEKQASVTIDGKKIDYTVRTSRLVIKKDDGKARASVFHVAYTRNGVKDLAKRPVLFAFNGGPGSSAVWLHMGALGPRILPTSEDGTQALKPPYKAKENPFSLLDVADLVFIDPVSTGYSRPEDKKEKFHGVDEDIESVGDFIRRWVTQHQRWSSPKYLLGESYGGVRAAGLANHLQHRFGMNLNGVVLLSSLMDFRPLSPSAGNDLAYVAFLPAFTAMAHYHGKIKGNRDTLVQQARDYAAGDYATALLKGFTLDGTARSQVAAQLAKLTGLPEQVVLRYNLRVGPSQFRKELLRADGKVLGRFDARTAWPEVAKAGEHPQYDPSMSAIKGPISSALLDYMADDLGWIEERPYEIIARIGNWNWGNKRGYVNVSSRLATAMRDNPYLRVLVQCGHADLATPAGGILHSLAHMHVPAPQRKNISVAWYEAGHMFYLNEPDLKKMREDLVKFLR